MGRSNSQTPPADATEVLETADVLTADQFADTPAVAIPMAGLLVDRPELLDAELSRDEWQAALDAYQSSTRP